MNGMARNERVWRMSGLWGFKGHRPVMSKALGNGGAHHRMFFFGDRTT